MRKNEAQVASKLISSFAILSKNKVTRTPALIINGRIYYGAITVKAISEYVESLTNG